jgi:peroxiredoxin
MSRLAGFLAIILMYACSRGEEAVEKVRLAGRVNHPNNGYIYPELQTPEGYAKIDSALLEADQSFLLSAAKGSEDIYRINFFGKQQINLVIGKDDLQIVADGNNPFGAFAGSGSADILVISKANQLATDQKIKSDLIMQKMRNAQNDRDSLAFFQWSDSLGHVNRNFETGLKDIIRKEAGSLTALMLINEYFDIEANLEFYDEQLDLFRESLVNHWQMEALNKEYQSIKKLAVGSIAPDFTLPDPAGEPVSLSSFRGKYVFVDFWASWCQPCRLENPDLVRVYKKFHGDQFEVVGVSFDRKRESWLKAIEKDGLEWVHVSDLQYFDSEIIQLYNIVNVPMTFLLDPEGKIIAKNIHADQLEKLLVEVL